jgi:hypothetical protein
MPDGCGPPALAAAGESEVMPASDCVQAPKIRVKMIGTVAPEGWLRHFPQGRPVWGRCGFDFDPAARSYDWLVVYNDLPSFCEQEEILACPRSHTLLITTEPSTIKAYGNAYTAQFGHVLTSQAAWALPHPRRIFSQPALHWFYGLGKNHVRGYDELTAHPPLLKTKGLSTVCSSKRQRHTLHNRRYEFTQALKRRIPELEIYGHGVRPMDDKAEALDDYRYHLAIENFIGEHHWTEKLADVFLGGALPFYAGCPNAGDYFPPESFIPVDIKKVESAAEIILRAMREGEYEKRLPHILEARRLVLEKYNIFSVLARIIEGPSASGPSDRNGGSICSRRLLRKRHPLIALSHIGEKIRLKVLHALRD